MSRSKIGKQALQQGFSSRSRRLLHNLGFNRAKNLEEKRNVFDDFRMHFGKEPPRVGAISIMTDTDNTGEEAVAWYGPIRILSLSDH
jgi:hypothetical protein